MSLTERTEFTDIIFFIAFFGCALDYVEVALRIARIFTLHVSSGISLKLLLTPNSSLLTPNS